MAIKNTYSETFKIRSSEVDPSGKMRLHSIGDLLQEVAGSNALELNFDISDLNTQNLTWVLHRLHIQMERYPKWRDSITIKTWPSGGNALRAYRDFLIFDDNGNEIGRSLSYWLMLDLESRRPVRIPSEILEKASEGNEHVLSVDGNRIKSSDQPDEFKSFAVRRSDLDLNGHVNNVKYIEWALEALPEEPEISEIDIEFRSECKYGDNIESGAVQANGAENMHIMRRQSNNDVVAVARSRAIG